MDKKNNLNIKPLDLKIVPTALNKSKKVMASCEIDGKISHYYIFIDKKEEYKDEDYIREAKKQLDDDIKNGVIKKKIATTTFKHPFVLGTLGVVGAIALTMTGLFTWKALTATGGGDVPPPPDPSNYVTLSLDAGEGSTIEGTTDKISKYYVKKGSTFADAFKSIHYVGGAKENEDFLYWTINNQPINEDYVINENIDLVATYKPVQTDCLTITAKQDNLSIHFNLLTADLKVSTDHENWEDVTAGAVVLEHAGDQIYVKRSSVDELNGRLISFSNKPHSISGPIEALANGKTSEFSFSSCFAADSNLITAMNLNLGNITLGESCYSNMFENCTSLITAPKLPATRLANNCYESMFSGCSSLTQAPALPATMLANYCYQGMFQYCTSLTTAPALPLMNLADGCYSCMFSNCASLITAPKLPAINLKPSCYQSMFENCTSLITAPELLAARLENNCYDTMFSGCSSLTQAPALPATTLATYCYQNMFQNCASLIAAPALSVTTLTNGCYLNMFRGCLSLTKVPKLPATTLTDGCYYGMFQDCTSLKIREESEATEDDNKIFTCPSSLPTTTTVTTMFSNTSGTFEGTPTVNKTYYWYVE